MNDQTERWASDGCKTERPAARRLALLAALAIGLAAETGLLHRMTGHGDFLQRGEAWAFTVLGLAAGLAYGAAAACFARVKLSARQGALVFWLAAAGLRVAILPVAPGDDVWRYRWEGRIQLHGFSPYQASPASPALAGLRDADWPKINHRDYPAIYPPLAELLFAALAWAGTPVTGYKLLFALADLGAAGLLRRLLARRGASPDLAAWYAWNPLAVYVGAGAAHFDSLMVLALLGAVWCLDRLPARPPPDAAAAWRVPPLAWAGAGLLGGSIALKAAPAVLLPVWFFALGWRRAVIALPLAVGVAPALAVWYGFPQVPVFGALGSFARDFRVNDAVWWLADPAERANRFAGLVAVAVCGALAVWFRRDWRRGTLWALGAALLLSPVLHAWYAVWVLPLAVWRGGRAWPWLVFSVSVFGYFLLWEVNHASGRPWQEPLWLRLLIYLSPLLAWGWDRWAYVDPPETW